MNFWKSVLFEEDDGTPPDPSNKALPISPFISDELGIYMHGEEDGPAEEDVVESSNQSSLSGWGLHNIIKTLREKSEEIINDYKEELEEFGKGLKEDTEYLVEKTGNKVKDLPNSLETGAHIAQESLEDVGQTIEEIGHTLWNGTKEILAHVKEAVAMVEEESALNARGKSAAAQNYTSTLQRGKYSRYEAQVSAMQRDSSTYCDEPEDEEDYSAWKKGFVFADKKQDVEAILKENAFMQELQSRIVPLIVEPEVFWTRYFYRLHKLQQAEDARADLVKRAANIDEEELSWDVDEDSESQASPFKGIVAEDASKVKEAATEKAELAADFVEVKAAESADVAAEPDTQKGFAVIPEEVVKESLGDSKISPSAELPPGHVEIEAVSDGNSSGSEWQVVSKESSPKNKEIHSENPTLPPLDGAADVKVDVDSVAVDRKGEVGKAPDSIGKSSTVQQEVKGNDEDWSEWE